MADALYFEDLEIGDAMPTLIKPPVTESQLVRYAGASGDFNPLHTVHGAGKAAGFGGVIAHGLLIMGFVTQGITQWIPNHGLRKIQVRFTGVTRPRDVITVNGKVAKKVAGENRIICTVEAKNQKGEIKIAGSFEAQLPSRG